MAKASDGLRPLVSDDRIYSMMVDRLGEKAVTAADVAQAMMDLRALYESDRERLLAKIALYEHPLTLGGYDHRFTDEGICVRCGEDAEEWDAGCVEEIVAGAAGEEVPQPSAANFGALFGVHFIGGE